MDSKKKTNRKPLIPTNAAEARRAVRNPKTGRKRTSIGMCTPTPLFVDFLSKFQDHILFPLALCKLPNGFPNIANSLTVCLFTLLLSLSTIQRVTTVGKAKRGLFLLGNVNGKVLLERLEIGTLGDTLLLIPCSLFADFLE